MTNATLEKNLYIPEAATLTKVTPMTANETLFEFKLDSGADLGHRPGQFVEVTVPGVGEAPISVSSSPRKKGGFELGVRKVGNVTNAMHRMKPGMKLGIRGPFGTSFPVDDAMKKKDILFISGGCGLVPLRSAIQYVLEDPKSYGHVNILFGCKSSKERLYADELARWGKTKGVTFKETVDKGDESWKGNVGVITTLLSQVKVDPKKAVALVVGPPVMYKFVLWDLTGGMGFSDDDVYVSLERRMKCGLGKCGHCQVNGFYACQDGPVFRWSQVKGAKEAI
jgi:NAD(P)H-flavin reductase